MENVTDCAHLHSTKQSRKNMSLDDVRDFLFGSRGRVSVREFQIPSRYKFSSSTGDFEMFHSYDVLRSDSSEGIISF